MLFSLLQVIALIVQAAVVQTPGEMNSPAGSAEAQRRLVRQVSAQPQRSDLSTLPPAAALQQQLTHRARANRAQAWDSQPSQNRIARVAYDEPIAGADNATADAGAGLSLRSLPSLPEREPTTNAASYPADLSDQALSLRSLPSFPGVEPSVSPTTYSEDLPDQDLSLRSLPSMPGSEAEIANLVEESPPGLDPGLLDDSVGPTGLGWDAASSNRDAALSETTPTPWNSKSLSLSLEDELDQIKPADVNDPLLQGWDQASGGTKSGSRSQAKSKLARKSAPRSPSQRENPGWWMQAIEQPLLSQRQSLPTSIDEVMFVALQNSPQVQILNTLPVIQETFVHEADAQFDWTQFVETSWNEIDEPVGSDLTTGAAGRFVERQWTLDAGMRRQLRNGASFSFTQRYGTRANNSSFLNPPNQGNSQLFLDYRQPLLQSRGRLVNTSQVALASLDFDAVSNESRTDLQVYLVSVVRSYWDVYFRRAALVIRRRGLQRGEELLRQLRLRDGIDVRNDQLLRAEAAVASRRSDVIRAQYDLVNAQDQLINVSVGPKYLAGTPEQVEFMPQAVELPLGIEYDATIIAQSAVYNRPEIQQSIAQLRAAAIQNMVSQNQVLPRLDAVLTATANGLRGNKDVGNAFTDQFTQGNPSYSAGFEFELPIGNRAAQYRAKRARMEMALAHHEFESQVGDVLVDARVASRNVSRLNRENQNNWEALLKANEELFLIQERQRLQLDDGKVGSLYIEDLLASQARLTAAEIRLAQSQTEQAVALIDLKRAVGVLLSGGNHVARPVRFSPAPFPESSTEQEIASDWPVAVNFEPAVPALDDSPMSNYPTPAELQSVPADARALSVADQQAFGWHMPAPGEHAVSQTRWNDGGGHDGADRGSFPVSSQQSDGFGFPQQ